MYYSNRISVRARGRRTFLSDRKREKRKSKIPTKSEYYSGDGIHSTENRKKKNRSDGRKYMCWPILYIRVYGDDRACVAFYRTVRHEQIARGLCVHIIIFIRNNPNQPRRIFIGDDSSLYRANLKRNLTTVIYVHGFTEQGNSKGAMTIKKGTTRTAAV